jgi:hypothetical protein
VQLDTWLPDQVHMMEVAGNSAANTYFEARLPAGQRPARWAPAPYITCFTPRNARYTTWANTMRRRDNTSALAVFIREKYAARKWVDPVGTWPPSTTTAACNAQHSHSSRSTHLRSLSPVQTSGSRLANSSGSAGAVVQSPPKAKGVNGSPTATSTSSSSPSPGQTNSNGAVGVLLPSLSDDEEQPGSVRSVLLAASAPSGPSCGGVLLDPSLGVLEWLDAQHLAASGGCGCSFLLAVVTGA